MMQYLLAFGASFIFVFLKSFQQLNVVHKDYWFILPTSMLMATCEVYVMYNAAHLGWGWLVVWVGAGGGLGSIFATYLHSRFLENKNKITS